MLCLGEVGFGQAWRTITPLKSVRTEVESSFGPSSDPYLASYSLKDGTLFVQYSSGPCRPETKGGWNVPEGTVVLVRFVPKSKKKLASLKLELSKFRRVVGGDVAGIVNYTNEETGVTYEVQRGRVDAIEYLPRKRYYSLKCAN
jgi:hypothetical protein